MSDMFERNALFYTKTAEQLELLINVTIDANARSNNWMSALDYSSFCYALF